jgi:hypothetical protein
MATLMTRHDGSGSPHDLHSGGASIRTELQHSTQTGPASGVSRTRAHAAQ